MPAFLAPLAISGLSGLAGLFGNRQQQQKIDQTQTNNVDMKTSPLYDEKTGALRDWLINLFMDQTKSNDDIFGGYERQGIQDINDTYGANQNIIDNFLAARGIRGPAAGFSSIAPQLQRTSEISRFRNNIPLLKDQRYQNILQAASGFLNSLPVGQSQYGTNTTRTTGTTTMPGNMLGGGLSSAATTLAGLYGRGAFGRLPGG